MPMTRIETSVPSMPSTTIRSPTPTWTAAANEASSTAPSGSEDRSQVPATISGVDIVGRHGRHAAQLHGERTALCSSVADAAWYGWPTFWTPGSESSSLVSVPFWK